MAAAVAMLCVTAYACTSQMARSPYIKDYVDRQEFTAALDEIEKIDKGTSLLLYLYERGLVLHYGANYEESNAILENAERLYEDLYTKSIAREATAFLTSDNVIQYRGDRFESAMIHYYKILNYILLKDTDGALVECRKLNNKLRTFRDSQDPVYPNDPFLQYLTGMVYMDAGLLSDADVSMRNAREAYAALADRYGVEVPVTLGCDLASCAVLLGDEEAASGYREEAQEPCEPGMKAGHGTLNVFLESGYVSYKVEQNIVLPIYKDDIGDEPDADEIAKGVTKRYGEPIDEGRGLDYLLRVALPVILPAPEPFMDAGIRVSVDDKPYVARAQLVENLDACALEAFEARQGAILLKTVTRAVTKYLAKEGADDAGFLAGLVVNVFNVATESADTRSWATLPHSIRMARLELPEGTYDLEILLHGESPGDDESHFVPGVEIKPGRATFANFRVN